MAHSHSARSGHSGAATSDRFVTSTAARRRTASPTGRRLVLVLWWLLTCMLVAVLVVVTRPASTEIVRLGPAEDETPAAGLPLDVAPRILLAPAEESAAVDSVEGPGLFVATGGPPLPLRAAPDRSAAVLVQVPNGAQLEDLGESTADGAWCRAGWNGWEGWIAAGVLRRRP
jgi:hypothetical protein